MIKTIRNKIIQKGERRESIADEIFIKKDGQRTEEFDNSKKELRKEYFSLLKEIKIFITQLYDIGGVLEQNKPLFNRAKNDKITEKIVDETLDVDDIVDMILINMALKKQNGTLWYGLIITKRNKKPTPLQEKWEKTVEKLTGYIV